MPDPDREGPKQIVYLVGAGATQAEADHLGARPVNLLMRDNDTGEGLSTRILRRSGGGGRAFLAEDLGIDIEKLISLLASSGAARHTGLAEKMRRLYFDEVRRGLAAAQVIAAPQLAIAVLERFAERMKSLNQRCINVAVVGVNYESDYVGWEGDRPYRHRLSVCCVDRLRPPPEIVSARLSSALLDRYDELLILRFRATNQSAYPFSWVHPKQVDLDYGAALTRIGELYQDRFG